MTIPMCWLLLLVLWCCKSPYSRPQSMACRCSHMFQCILEILERMLNYIRHFGWMDHLMNDFCIWKGIVALANCTSNKGHHLLHWRRTHCEQQKRGASNQVKLIKSGEFLVVRSFFNTIPASWWAAFSLESTQSHRLRLSLCKRIGGAFFCRIQLHCGLSVTAWQISFSGCKPQIHVIRV